MRRLTQNLAFCIAMGAVAATSCSAEIIRWETDLEAAFQQAQATNRPLLLHFWSPDCAPCRRLEQTVFNQPRVAEAVHDHFIPVKIDASRHPRLASRYGVKSVPNDVIVTPDDQELHRMFSPQDPEQYVAQLSAVAFKAGSVKSPARTAIRPGPRPGGVPTSEQRWAQYARDDALAGRPNTKAIDSHGNYSARSTRLPQEGYSGSPATNRYAPPSDEPREVINRFARREQRKVGPTVTHHNDVEAEDPEPTRESPRGSWPNRSAQGESAEAYPTEGRYHEPVGPVTSEGRFASEHRTDAGQPSRQDAAPAAGGNHVAATTSDSAPLGMDGYCPVSLIRKNSWTKGDPRYGVIHRGRTYLFAGPEEKEIFYADPDEYGPVLSGIDPVELTAGGAAVEGQRAHGVVYRKRVYLFATEKNLQKFWEEPERYASPIRQAMVSGDVGSLFR